MAVIQHCGYRPFRMAHSDIHYQAILPEYGIARRLHPERRSPLVRGMGP